MTEKELLNAIKKSASTTEIPQSLKPEEMITQLHRQNRKKTKFYHFSLHYFMQRVVSSAAVLLLCGFLSTIAWNINSNTSQTSSSTPEVTATEESNIASSPVAESEENISEPAAQIPPKQNAGSLYKIAKSYEDVYKLINSSQQKEIAVATGGSITDEATTNIDSNITESTTDINTTDISFNSKESFTETNVNIANDLTKKTTAKKEGTSSSRYSSTNLQTEGVDESDKVKTDGRYIYTVTNSKILITDTKDRHLTPVGSIAPTLEASDSILEFYVDQNKLLLLIQHYDNSIEGTKFEDNTDTTYIEDSNPLALDSVDISCPKYTLDKKSQTILYTYNIENPATPVLEGKITQDGIYRTSRKINNIVYLFTDQRPSYTAAKESKDTNEFLIPCINEEMIPHENIYLPDQGNQGLILSSINIHNPDQIVDNIMILHNFVNIYVGTDSIYLYQENFYNGQTLTEIAGFSMDNGILNAINATSVNGYILDTFAINEFQRCLRILTTSCNTSSEDSNNLYLLDKNMQLTGSLTGIAKGEQIYAARYFNNTAYFITYRNTDPLFAVDISNPSSPKLLGELKITGFSEYLHFWENNKLLGIGYETDPDTGETEGLKLVMFDISNPTDLKVIDTVILKNYTYSPALYNYKSILVNSNENLIGFPGKYETFSIDYTHHDSTFNYLLFTWETNHFTKKLTEPLSEKLTSDHLNLDYLRGIYIDDIFYIADLNKIKSFDRKNDYHLIEELNLQ